MDRRRFLRTVSTAGAAGMAGALQTQNCDSAENAQAEPFSLGDTPGYDFRGPRTLLFWDYWPLARYNNVKLVQATAKYRPEGDYADPKGSTGGGRVFFHEPLGKWRKIYGSKLVCIHESDDGIHWRPSPQPDAKPEGGQKERAREAL